MVWGETKNLEKMKKVFSKEDRLKELQKQLKQQRYSKEPRLVTLIAGKEGTGKTGITLDYIHKKFKDKKDDYCRYIDLDGGADVLLGLYPDIEDKCYITNPMIFNNTDGEYSIDYIATFNKIKSDISAIKELHDLGDTHCQMLVIDGLSTLLKHAERQMRLEKNLTADGGVSTRFWMNRNKYFEEILEFSKSLPIDVVFIAHEDFIRAEKELASIKQKTLALVYQIIETKRAVEGEKTIFSATIKKSKLNILAEDTTVIFAEKENDKYIFDVKDLFTKLKVRKNV